MSKGEGRRRDAERKSTVRRKAGVAPRSTYEAVAEHRREVASALRSEGLSYRKIAGSMGISLGEAHRLLK